MRNFLFNGLTIVLLGIYADQAFACSCGSSGKTLGFLSDSGALLLPANAKGVIFAARLTDFDGPRWLGVSGTLDGEKAEVYLTQAPIQTFEAAQFEVQDLYSGELQDVRLRPLPHAEQVLNPETRPLLRFRDEQATQCFWRDQCEGAPQWVLELRESRKNWPLQSLVDDGRLEQLEPSVGAYGTRYFRVEPTVGFESGRDYQISWLGHQPAEPGSQGERTDESIRSNILVSVSEQKLTPEILSRSRLKLNEPEDKLMSFSAGVSCSINALATAIDAEYVYPKEVEPFAHLLRFHTRWRDDASISTRGDFAAFQPWRYSSNLCSGAAPGRSGWGHGQEQLVSTCPSAEQRHRGLPRGLNLQLRGALALLEIRDEFYETLSANFNVAQTQCDASGYLRKILASTTENDAAGPDLCALEKADAIWREYADESILQSLLSATRQAMQTDGPQQRCARRLFPKLASAADPAGPLYPEILTTLLDRALKNGDGYAVNDLRGLLLQWERHGDARADGLRERLRMSLRAAVKTGDRQQQLAGLTLWAKVAPVLDVPDLDPAQFYQSADYSELASRKVIAILANARPHAPNTTELLIDALARPELSQAVLEHLRAPIRLTPDLSEALVAANNDPNIETSGYQSPAMAVRQLSGDPVLRRQTVIAMIAGGPSVDDRIEALQVLRGLGGSAATVMAVRLMLPTVPGELASKAVTVLAAQICGSCEGEVDRDLFILLERLLADPRPEVAASAAHAYARYANDGMQLNALLRNHPETLSDLLEGLQIHQLRRGEFKQLAAFLDGLEQVLSNRDAALSREARNNLHRVQSLQLGSHGARVNQPVEPAAGQDLLLQPLAPAKVTARGVDDVIWNLQITPRHASGYILSWMEHKPSQSRYLGRPESLTRRLQLQWLDEQLGSLRRALAFPNITFKDVVKHQVVPRQDGRVFVSAIAEACAGPIDEKCDKQRRLAAHSSLFDVDGSNLFADEQVTGIARRGGRPADNSKARRVAILPLGANDVLSLEAHATGVFVTRRTMIERPKANAEPPALQQWLPGRDDEQGPVCEFDAIALPHRELVVVWSCGNWIRRQAFRVAIASG